MDIRGFWMDHRVDNNYINIVNYKPLNGSSYIELPTKLKKLSKRIDQHKNKDDECFRWCYSRHLNPQSKDPQRIKKADKQCIDSLDYSNIIFPITKLRNRTALESTYLVMKKNNHSLFTFVKKSSKTK